MNRLFLTSSCHSPVFSGHFGRDGRKNKMKILSKKLIGIFFLLFFLILANPVFSIGVCEPCDGEPCNGGLECISGVCKKPGVITICPPIKAKTFEDLVSSITGFLLKIALVIAPLMIIIAGFFFITAGGSPKQISKAKKIILYTCLGVAVVLLSHGMVGLIGGILEGGPLPEEAPPSPTEKSALLVLDTTGEAIVEELEVHLGSALLGVSEGESINVGISDDEITTAVSSVLAEPSGEFSLEDFEITFETVKISAHILKPVKGKLLLIGELTKRDEKSINFKIKKGFFNNSPLPETLLQRIGKKIEKKINKSLSVIPNLHIENLEVKNGKLIFKGRAEIFPEIKKIINQIKEKDPALAEFLLRYLARHHEEVKIMEKTVKAYLRSEPQSLSISEHSQPGFKGKSFISEDKELTCQVSTPFYYIEFTNVFEHRVKEDWDESGNWNNDWEAVNDATSFGPSILYKCARKHNNSELERRANKTVEYEIRLIDEIIKGNRSKEIIAKAGGGQYALIAGRKYYSGNERQKVEIYSRAMAIGPTLTLIYKPKIAENFPVGAVVGISSVSNYNFELAKIIKNQLEKKVYIRLGQYLIKNNLEKYWKEDKYGRYYKSPLIAGEEPPKGPIAFEQGFPLMALAGAYKFNSDFRYFDRAKEIKKTLDENLWDSREGKKGYFEYLCPKDGEGGGRCLQRKNLSSNNFITQGYLSWYKLTKEKDFLNKSKRIFKFIIKELYVEDRGLFLHDTGTIKEYCSGCNFRTLDNFWIASEIINFFDSVSTLSQYYTVGTPQITPEEIFHYNPAKNSGWFYIAQTIPEDGIAFWASIVRSKSTKPTDPSAQLLYGITDTNTGNHYSGFLDGGSFSEHPDQINLFYQKENKKLIEFHQTKEDLSEFELKVNLPWDGTSLKTTKTLTFSRPILYESGDGIIPMAEGIDSFYTSIVTDQGFWIDFQKFNAEKSLLQISSRYPKVNHRWGSFILNKDVGILPAGTVGVAWEILDENNRRQLEGYTNVDLLVPGYPQFTAKESQIEKIKIKEIETWSSPHKTYLKKWKMSYPAGIELLFETLIPDQENEVIDSYFYEGMIKVIDPQTGEVVGTGMLEQTHDEASD